MPVQLNLVLQKEGRIFYDRPFAAVDLHGLKTNESVVKEIQFPVEVETGFYEMMISLKTGNLSAGLQGDYVLIHIK